LFRLLSLAKKLYGSLGSHLGKLLEVLGRNIAENHIVLEWFERDHAPNMRLGPDSMAMVVVGPDGGLTLIG